MRLLDSTYEPDETIVGWNDACDWLVENGEESVAETLEELDRDAYQEPRITVVEGQDESNYTLSVPPRERPKPTLLGRVRETLRADYRRHGAV